MDNKNISIQITSGTFIKAVLIAAGIALLYALRDVALIVLLSVVIASGIEPAAAWFQKRKLPRTIAVILTYLMIFAILGAMFYLVVPTIFEEFSNFNAKLSVQNGAKQGWDFLGESGKDLPPFAVDIFKEITAAVTDFLGQFVGNFFGLIMTVFGGALSFVLTIVFSFYLSVQERGIENFLKIIIPLHQEEYILDLWQRTKQKIGYWFQGQLLLGFIIGVLAYLGLTLMGLEYALTFAILAGFFELIPIFGPILSAVPPIIMALSHSTLFALGVAAFYFLIQQFENHLIYPLVVRKVVGIPPIIVILALVIGAKLGGFVGLLLAVPVSTFLNEYVKDLETEKHKHLNV